MAKATNQTRRTTKPGAVAKEIAKLLTGRKNPLSYEAIAQRVRERIPEAHTSARSVASIASTMRKQGVKLPDRRTHAAA